MVTSPSFAIGYASQQDCPLQGALLCMISYSFCDLTSKYAAEYSCLWLNELCCLLHEGLHCACGLFRIELSPCREGLGQVLMLEPIKEVSMTTGTKMGTQHIFGSTRVNSPTSTLADNFTASLSLKSPVAHYFVKLQEAGEKTSICYASPLHSLWSQFCSGWHAESSY